jgi:hypothetical protein
LSRGKERIPRDFESTVYEVGLIHKRLENEVESLLEIAKTAPDMLVNGVYRELMVKLNKIATSISGLLQEEEKADLFEKLGELSSSTKILDVLNYSNPREAARTLVLLAHSIQLAIFVRKQRYDRIDSSPAGKEMKKVSYVENGEVREIIMPKAMYDLSEQVRYMIFRYAARVSFILEVSYHMKLGRILEIQKELKKAEISEERFVPSAPITEEKVGEGEEVEGGEF